jgi:pyruvate/2-oxoglutarate dehydrogenase complex dihydrolipoamide dehydrogenase (E3) component
MRVVVIGGGPAGVTAALHAAELRAEVILIERGRVGGTAFNRGPAPVRTLARAARLVRDWSSWETFGLRGASPEVDVPAVLANAQRVADYAYDRKRMADHIRSLGVELVEDAGDARFVDANTVAVGDGCQWTADRVIIAVGGKAGRLPIPGAELGLTFDDLRTLTTLPDRICVIGAADTGCQLTSILADFGCSVTLVEYASRIVQRADADVSDALGRAFRGRGIEVVTGAAVERLDALEPGVRVLYRVGDEATTLPQRPSSRSISRPASRCAMTSTRTSSPRCRVEPIWIPMPRPRVPRRLPVRAPSNRFRRTRQPPNISTEQTERNNRR